LINYLNANRRSSMVGD